MKKWFLILLAALLLLAVACKAPEDPSAAPETDTQAQAPGTDAPVPGGDATTAPEPTTATPAPETTPEPEATPAPEATPEPTMPPPPEEPEYDPLPEELLPLNERVLGEWYADAAGLIVTLALTEDGYTISVPGIDAKNGKWEAKDGVIVLDGDEENPLLPIGDVIRSDAPDLLFTREQPIAYVPADVIADAKDGAFDGFFKAQFVAVGSGTILAAAVGEDAFVYIEGTNVALGGTRFGNVIKVFTAAPGALTLAEDGLNVKLELLQDGLLQMTLPDAVIYLMPAVVPGTEPETP